MLGWYDDVAEEDETLITFAVDVEVVAVKGCCSTTVKGLRRISLLKLWRVLLVLVPVEELMVVVVVSFDELVCVVAAMFWERFSSA